MRGSVMLLGFNQTPEGYVQACPYAERATPPAKGEWGPFQSDEFAAWFVPVLYDYYLYSGDAKTARELYPNVLKLMDYLAAHTENDGTFIQRAETSKHACNLNLGDTSHRAYMDILLWKCCIDAAALAALQKLVPNRHKIECAELCAGQVVAPQLQRVALAGQRGTAAQLGIERLAHRVCLVHPQ